MPILLKGEVKYLNQTTYLGSQIGFVCSPGYRLTGPTTRECMPDGKWGGHSPKCEEIRCPAPEMPANSSVIYSNNDRSSTDSFKIGSTVQYRCSAGHTVVGQSLRTCEIDASWTGDAPECKCKQSITLSIHCFNPKFSRLQIFPPPLNQTSNVAYQR